MNFLFNFSFPASAKGAKAKGEEGEERVEEHIRWGGRRGKDEL